MYDSWKQVYQALLEQVTSLESTNADCIHAGVSLVVRLVSCDFLSLTSLAGVPLAPVSASVLNSYHTSGVGVRAVELGDSG